MAALRAPSLKMHYNASVFDRTNAEPRPKEHESMTGGGVTATREALDGDASSSPLPS